MICLQITRSPFIWKSRHVHVGTLEIETTYWAFPVALLTTYSRLNELIIFAFLIFITADSFLAVFVLFSTIFASDLCFFVGGLHSSRSFIFLARWFFPSPNPKWTTSLPICSADSIFRFSFFFPQLPFDLDQLQQLYLFKSKMETLEQGVK